MVVDASIWTKHEYKCYTNECIIFDDGTILNTKHWYIIPWTDNHGYKRFTHYVDGKSRDILVHRVVAMLFVENPNGYTVVHHKDGNTINNNYTNLMWISKSDHSKLHNKNSSIGSHPNAHKVSKTNGDIEYQYESVADAARKNSITPACVYYRCVNETTDLEGFSWSYARIEDNSR